MESAVDKKQECQKWYNDNKCILEACGDTVKRLIEVLLQQNNAPYYSMGFRVKTESSFLNKCENEKYDDPISQITDVCGLRIISYTNHDVETICRIIENEFEVDTENSVNKGEQMRDDQVGYLSVHYVVSLKQERAQLPEYSSYKDIKFEIQVRTLLQHAWAEIEHDRNYKFSGELPSEIKRRFYLVAGTLEMLDREFEQLSKDIDKYANDVRIGTQQGNLDVAINTTSLLEYLPIRLKGIEPMDDPFNGYDKIIISELQDFGINLLSDLDKIICDKLFESPEWRASCINYLGALRDIMMVNDPDKYFEQAWHERWRGMNRKAYEFLSSLNPKMKKHKSKFIFNDDR